MTGYRRTSIVPAAASTSATVDDMSVLAADEPLWPLVSNGLPPPLWSLRLVCALPEDEDVDDTVDCADGLELVSTTRPVAVLDADGDVLADEGVADASIIVEAELLDEIAELLAAAALDEVAGAEVVLAAVDCGLEDVDDP